MIAEPQPTPYDLKFRSFGFPVRVHPFFWVIAAALGANALSDPVNGVLFLVMWVGLVFVSILIHELGHAFAFRNYRGDARIWLYWFGGLAISQSTQARPKQRIVIALAGPAAGFIFAAILYLTNLSANWRDYSRITQEAYFQLMWINIAWGVINLLPIFPLDGGQVSREVCTLSKLRRPDETAFRISLGTAGAGVLYSLMCMAAPPGSLDELLPDWLPRGSFYTALMFGMLAYGSWQQLQMLGRGGGSWSDRYDDDYAPWRGRR